MKNEINNKTEKRKLGSRILHNTITKIIIGIIVCVGLVALGQEGLKSLFELISLEQRYKRLIISILVAVIAVLSYMVLYKFYEKRKITELSGKGLSGNLFFGLALGVVLQSLTIFVIYIYGGFSVISVNSFIYLIPPLTMAVNAAVFEEILFRGIIYRLIEEKLGSYIALAISALIFGALHLANPNSSIVGALGLAVQAGLLLGAAYIYSKNLWFPIALHFAWNFTQSGIFGASTSGRVISNSLLTTKIEGTEIITGGQFGPEGSIQATIFCLMATVMLLILNHKQNKIIKPYWAKK